MLSISSKVLKCEAAVAKNAICFLLIRTIHSKPIKVSWEKPAFGCTKLNFDGSSRGKSASIGGVFRDHNAEFKLGYAEPIGRKSSTIAEFAALRRGLELVLENGWNHIWLEGDSQFLINAITKNIHGKCKEVRKQAEYINEIIAELDVYKLTHIYREGNKVADKLADMGHRLGESQVWTHPPKEILAYVHDDAHGKVVFRNK